MNMMQACSSPATHFWPGVFWSAFSALVLCQPLKLGLNCICTTDFQSVGGILCRRTGSPSYPKIEP